MLFLHRGFTRAECIIRQLSFSLPIRFALINTKSALDKNKLIACPLLNILPLRKKYQSNYGETGKYNLNLSANYSRVGISSSEGPETHLLYQPSTPCAICRSHSGSLYLLERRLVISFRLCHSAFYIIYLAGKTT